MILSSMTVQAKNTVETTYRYDYWNRVVEDLPFYTLHGVIDQTSAEGVTIGSMDDITISNNRIYIVDSTSSRVHVFDENFELVTSLRTLRNESGGLAIVDDQQVTFNNPQGIFVHEKSNEIYIADTGNKRIIVIDATTYAFKRIINEPDNMVGDTSFVPSKIVVDNIDRIYVVVQGGFEGILELTSDGSFSRYFGVSSPKVNMLDQFWKSIASDEQQVLMTKTFAPSFNNLDIDSSGFIYATTYDSTATEVVFRFNPNGDNVIRELGYTPIIGDLRNDESTGRESAFIDIAVNDFGVYAVLDQNNGRIFVYNFDGELMTIFGGKGFENGQFTSPTSIDFLGDYIIATDNRLNTAMIYSPTTFGQLALNAADDYYNGLWDEATEQLLEAVSINGNYDIAYSTIGKSYLMREEYETAMYYFELADNKTYYSEAFNGYRGIWLQEHFIWFFLGFIVVVGLIVYSEVRYFSNLNKKGESE